MRRNISHGHRIGFQLLQPLARDDEPLVDRLPGVGLLFRPDGPLLQVVLHQVQSTANSGLE